MTGPQKDGGRSGTVSRPPSCADLIEFQERCPRGLTGTFLSPAPLRLRERPGGRDPRPEHVWSQDVDASPPAWPCLSCLSATVAVALLTQVCRLALRPVGCKASCLDPVSGPRALLSGPGHPGSLISRRASSLGACELIRGPARVEGRRRRGPCRHPPGAVRDSRTLLPP